jgi:bifunctional DNA-binding transcriptional regulator/antitoxin component of YhaV-PrlF toxin-antitoxin module
MATHIQGAMPMMNTEIKRIKISEKRQITIPIKFYEMLHFGDEVEVFVKNGTLVIRPTSGHDDGFTEEILKDLIEQGYEGQELLYEYKRVKAQIRPAVEYLLDEAEKVATEARKNPNRTNKTAEIFADLED